MTRIGTLAGAILTTFATAAFAEAAMGPVTIVVTCAELSPEERANVEAMVRADLLTRAIPIGHVRLDCQADWVMVEFDLGAGRVVSHGEPKVSARSQIAEQLIALSDRLVSSDFNASSAQPLGAKPLPSNPANIVSPPAMHATSGTVQTTMDIPPPSRGTVGTRGRLQLRGTMQLVPRKRIGGRTETAFELLGGMEFDPLLPDSWGMLGPRAGIAAVIRERFAVVAITSMGWALERPKEVALRDHRAGLGFEWRASEHISLGMSAQLTALYVTVPIGVSPRTRWSPLEPACQLNLGYRWRWATASFGIYPTFTAYAHARAVRLDSAAVMDIPQLLVGVVAQTALRL